jgi:hypothetical protein
MTSICRLLASLLLITSAPLLAQDKPLPPPRDFKPETRRAADVLPVLHLPEYVITGSDVARFTDDRKGGIDEPDARSLTSRAGRGAREQRFMSAAPTRLPLALADLRGIEEVFGLRAGYGSFSTPFVHAWFANRFDHGDVFMEGDWERSDGHVRLAGYEQVNVRGGGGVYLPATAPRLFASSRLEGEFAAEHGSYGLYADKLQHASPLLDFERRADHVFLRGGLLSRKNALFDHELSLFFASTYLEERLSVADTLPVAPWDQMEQRFGLHFGSRHTLGALPLQTRARWTLSDLRQQDDEDVRPFYLANGVSGRFAFSDALILDAALDLMLFRGNRQATAFRAYPSVKLTSRLHDSYSVWAAYEPEVREQSFDGLRRVNPFLMLASEIRHTDIPLRFNAGVAYDNRRATSGRLFMEYFSTSSWPRFDLLPDPVRQQWELRYGSLSTVFAVHAELHHHFSKRTRIQVQTALRMSRDDELGEAIPYLPPLEVRALLTHDFPFGLSIQAESQLVGEQYTQEASIPSWLMLGLTAEYRVFRNAGVFIHMSNLLDNEFQRWRGYYERPFFISGGLQLRM